MALINPPTSGQINIAGKPVMDGPRALVDLRAFRRQNLGFVFQKANLIPFLTAWENVKIALEVNDTAPRTLLLFTGSSAIRLLRHFTFTAGSP